MKKLLILFIVGFAFSQNCFSQEKYEWYKVQKVELYSLKKIKKASGISSKDLNLINLEKSDSDKISSHINQIEEYEFDVLLEQKCYVLRVYFPNSFTDFIYYPEQGVLFKMNNETEYFKIKKKEEFLKLIESFVKAKGK